RTFNQNFFVNRTVSKRIIKMKSFVQAFREEIFSQGIKFTSLIDNHAATVAGFARRNRRFTMHLRDMLKAVVYDTEKDVFKFGHIGKFFQPAAIKEIQNIFDIAFLETKNQMRLSKFLRREADFGKIFLQEAGKAVASSHLSLTDKKTMLAFFKSAEFQPVLEVATKNANLIRKSTLRNFIENPLVLKTFVGAENITTPSETELVIADNMPAFEGKVPEFASIIKHGEDYVLKFMGGPGEVIDFSAFKLAFADTDGFINFVRQAISKGKDAKIELKFLPNEGNTFWYRNVRSAFITNKEKLLSGRGSVSLISNGKMYETGITLRTYKKYDGVQLIVHDDLGLGGVVTALKDNKQLPVTLEGSLLLPKYQLKNYLKFTKGADLTNPIKISLLNGRNKIAALNLTQALSFSAASTGLAGYLTLIYPELSAGEISLISVVIPYCLSAFTPFVSPIVKKFGASKVLKTSMALSAASLIIPMHAGFTGVNGIQEDNPFEKPSPYWLYPSAMMIALAAILTRGSFSPLIQSIGGGSGTLKAVAFKSVSGFLFVIPPMVGAALDYLKPQYFKNQDGSFYLDDNGEKVQKHWLDFSVSYPFMFVLAGGALYKLQKSQFNVRIGKEIGYKVGGIKGFANEVSSSYKVLFGKEARNLTMASMLLAGVEGSLLYNYSVSKSNEYFTQHVNTEALIPFLAILGVNVPAFFARFYSKPYLKFMGGDNLLGYRNMTTMSIGLAGTGAYLMMNRDDDFSFAAGMVLTSIGCSQLTSSILRYGHVKFAKELKMPSHVVTSWDVSYPTTLFGLSIIPFTFSKLADASISGVTTENKAQKRSLKNTAYKEAKFVPWFSLAGGSLLLYRGMSATSKFNLLGNTSILAPFGLAGEIKAHSPFFPTPNQKMILKTPFNLDGADSFRANNFGVNQFKANVEMPEFKLTPMAQ
nr:hypothetical protein [Elusimicrobiaceae bacterium]